MAIVVDFWEKFSEPAVAHAAMWMFRDAGRAARRARKLVGFASTSTPAVEIRIKFLYYRSAMLKSLAQQDAMKAAKKAEQAAKKRKK